MTDQTHEQTQNAPAQLVDLRARHAEVVAQIEALTQRKESLEKFIALIEKTEKETHPE